MGLIPRLGRDGDGSAGRRAGTASGAALGEPFPARTAIYMRLPPGLLVGIDALAVLDA
ncbi:hypothetical protein AB0M05_44095 [Streptomyces violaceusniger]|uniref:hypothetical protein n=1 Tax=Streptomyces violaceusniger TaxID=68280 RepID=UPI003441A474